MFCMLYNSLPQIRISIKLQTGFQWDIWLWIALAIFFICGWYSVTAALITFSKCLSVKQFRFFYLMLVIADNPASHRCFQTLSILFYNTSISVEILHEKHISYHIIQNSVGCVSLCLSRRALLCCISIISSCTAPSSPPNNYIFVATVAVSHVNASLWLQ